MGLQSLRVLVVEDHGFQRRMALRMLAELGIENAWEAADGHAALGVLHGIGEPPDVVLVDLDMPGMDGVDRQAAQTARLPGRGPRWRRRGAGGGHG